MYYTYGLIKEALADPNDCLFKNNPQNVITKLVEETKEEINKNKDLFRLMLHNRELCNLLFDSTAEQINNNCKFLDLAKKYL